MITVFIQQVCLIGLFVDNRPYLSVNRPF